MFQPSLNRYKTRSQMTVNTPLRKKYTGYQALSFLGPKIWIKHSKNVKPTAFFTLSLKEKL